MTKLKNKDRTFLNTDTGAIFFLFGVAILLSTLAHIFLREPHQSLVTHFWLGLLGIVLIVVGCSITLRARKDSEYEIGPGARDELRSSLEKAMELAWRDHHHARDQTWKGLQMEALLAIALIGMDLGIQQEAFKHVPLVGSILLFLIAISGIMITLHHRELERRKFRHIMHCEDALGLRSYIDGVGLPATIYIWDVFSFWKCNTVLFIMRMHFALIVFSVWFFMTRGLCVGQ